MKKTPDPIDVYIGGQVRMRRLMLGMSQGKLAEALGVSFQQVQKNEKGTNRIGSSRLHQIAEVLGVSVPFFFEGLHK
jgi:transcriptional regulator with XRE-family HTH domain